MKKIKSIFAFFLITVFCLVNEIPVCALEVNAPSVVLMETTTGKVIYEKDAYAKRSPASVTKVMTLLLILKH